MYVISRPGPLRPIETRREQLETLANVMGGRSMWKRPRTTPIVREDRVRLKGRVAFDLVVAAQAAPGCLLVLVFSCFIIPICFNSLTSSARFHRRYPHRSRISLFPATYLMHTINIQATIFSGLDVNSVVVSIILLLITIFTTYVSGRDSCLRWISTLCLMLPCFSMLRSSPRLHTRPYEKYSRVAQSLPQNPSKL